MSNSDPKEKNREYSDDSKDWMKSGHQGEFKLHEIKMKHWDDMSSDNIITEEYAEALYKARRETIKKFDQFDFLIQEFESQDSIEMSLFDHFFKKLIEPLNSTFQNILKPTLLLFSMKMGTTLISPPKTGEKILYLFLSKDARKHIPGDLEEEFTAIILPKFGARYARIWYWKQVFSSIVPIIQGRLMKWGAIAWAAKAAEWVSSRFSS